MFRYTDLSTSSLVEGDRTNPEVLRGKSWYTYSSLGLREALAVRLYIFLKSGRSGVVGPVLLGRLLDTERRLIVVSRTQFSYNDL
jgi:hypothetical protein